MPGRVSTHKTKNHKIIGISYRLARNPDKLERRIRCYRDSSSQPYAVSLVLLNDGEDIFHGKSLNHDRKIHCRNRYYEQDIVA